MNQLYRAPYPPFGLSEEEWEKILARTEHLPLTALRRVCEDCKIHFDEPPSLDDVLLVLDEAPSLEHLIQSIEREETRPTSHNVL